MNVRINWPRLWWLLAAFLVALGFLTFGAPHAKAAPCPCHTAPYICYDPAHAQDLLCSGTYSQRPPGYSLQDPGTWQPWPKYSPVPGGRY